MSTLQATVKLRPTRIGFLVSPRDTASVKRIMRLNACLWGGFLNPIIPVFRNAPEEWAPESYQTVKGYDIARGYIRFFEPDVFVETEKGLLEKVGLNNFRERHSDPLVVTLDNFLDSERWGHSEPVFGLSIFDILRHRYETERKFRLRDELLSIDVRPVRGSAVAETVFGCLPSDEGLQYLVDGYRDVFEPTETRSLLDAWCAVFEKGANTPLRLTKEALTLQASGRNELVIYIFDPRKTTDTIDLWNMRLESTTVLPVPIDLVSDLAGRLCEIVKAEFRPLKGNPNGIMHHTTVEFGRSISKERAENISTKTFSSSPKGSYALKLWRNEVWTKSSEFYGPNYHRLISNCEEQRQKLQLADDRSSEFETLSPIFADKYGGRNSRWANTISVGEYGHSNVATTLPFNILDRSWPQLGMWGESVPITSEGWVFLQKYKRWTQPVFFMEKHEAIVGWLEQKGIEAQLSEPGRIAKQMVESLKGMWGLHVLKDADTLKLLNSMAGSLRRRSNDNEDVEENFDGKAHDIKKWVDLVAIRRNKSGSPRLSVEDFTNRNVLRIGLETVCPHCQTPNWKGLDVVDYLIVCDRCLKKYDFPQGNLKQRNENWKYRVIGPFSLPDFGRGSYSSLLSIKALSSLSVHEQNSTFSTALDFAFDGNKAEVDFALWIGSDGGFEGIKEPAFILGEAKSFSDEAIKSKDIKQMKLVSKKLPDAGLVFSVLKDKFSENEKDLLSGFVEWSRRSGPPSTRRRPVILMTGVELFARRDIKSAWKAKGSPYEPHAEFHTLRTLEAFAEATQEIHLGTIPYYDWLAQERSRTKT